MYPHKLGAAHPLHSSADDGHWGILWWSSLEVSNHLFGLLYVKDEIVIFAPLDQ